MDFQKPAQVELFDQEPEWLKKARQVYDHFDDHYRGLSEAARTAVRESRNKNIGTVRCRTGKELNNER